MTLFSIIELPANVLYPSLFFFGLYIQQALVKGVRTTKPFCRKSLTKRVNISIHLKRGGGALY